VAELAARRQPQLQGSKSKQIAGSGVVLLERLQDFGNLINDCFSLGEANLYFKLFVNPCTTRSPSSSLE
jgi:hypothetical protein